MPKSSLSVSLKGADDIFSTEESRQEQQREQVQQIPIGELFPFKDHPFKVLYDESMQRTVSRRSSAPSPNWIAARSRNRRRQSVPDMISTSFRRIWRPTAGMPRLC